MLTTSSSTLCTHDQCASYLPGHLMHFIHADLVAREPALRPAIVSRVEGRELLLSHPITGATAHVWHHEVLDDVLVDGHEVLLHEGRHAVAVRGQLINVRLTGTLGPLEVGEVANRPTAYVIDIARGRGLDVRED